MENKYLQFLVEFWTAVLPLVVKNKLFETLIMVSIVANCVILVIADYSHVDINGDLVADGSIRNTIVTESEYVFTSIFTLECVLKIACSGLIGKNSYLADRWNWLDFLVVISG